MLARYHATYSAVDRVLVGVLVLACGAYRTRPRRGAISAFLVRCTGAYWIVEKHANIAREVRTIRFDRRVLNGYKQATVRVRYRVWVLGF